MSTRCLTRTPRRGNYSMFMGVLIPVVFGFTAIGLDISYLQLCEMQSQQVADAASHAAFVAWRATSDPDEGAYNAGIAAQHIIDSNLIGTGHATLDGVLIGGWDPEVRSFDLSAPYLNAAKVEISRAGDNAIQMFMAPVMGKSTPPIYSESVTAGRTREIMVVQDITGSYKDDIDLARDANLAFLDYLVDHPYPGDMIGMSVFIGGVDEDVWDPISIIMGNEASITSRWSELDSCNCDPYRPDGIAGLYPEEDCDWIREDTDAGGFEDTEPCLIGLCEMHYGNSGENIEMPDCYAVGAGTAPGPGLDQAVDELLEVGNPTSFQAVVLNSDGLPCCGDDETTERKAATVAAVDRAWEEGIHVWVVGFNEGGAADFGFLESLSRGQGVSYETPDAETLSAIMLEIAASIPLTLVR